MADIKHLKKLYSQYKKIQEKHVHNEKNLKDLKGSFNKFIDEESREYNKGGKVKGYANGEEVQPDDSPDTFEPTVITGKAQQPASEQELEQSLDDQAIEKPYANEDLAAELEATEPEKNKEEVPEEKEDKNKEDIDRELASDESKDNDKDLKSDEEKSDDELLNAEEPKEDEQTNERSSGQRLLDLLKPGTTANDLAAAQKARSKNIAMQQLEKGAALAGSGIARVSPDQALKIIGEKDKYINLPVESYQEQIKNQQFDPNSTMSQVVRDYLTSKGLKVPERSSAGDLLKVAPFLAKDSALQTAIQKALLAQKSREEQGDKNRAQSEKNAQIRADAIKAGQGKSAERQDQRLAGQVVQRVNNDPVVKPSIQNMASLQKSKALLENKSLPLTPQVLADAEQDIASALTIRGLGGSEGKIKRTELMTLNRKIAEAKQLYLNQPDIDLRKEDPALVNQILKTNRALYDDYDSTIKDRKKQIASEYSAMGENSPRIQKTIDQYIKPIANPSPEDSQALEHYNSMPDTDPNKAALGAILQKKGLM